MEKLGGSFEKFLKNFREVLKRRCWKIVGENNFAIIRENLYNLYGISQEIEDNFAWVKIFKIFEII